MNTKQKSIMLLGDLIIPLFGYYSLNWSLYFIALYYILDLIGFNIFYQLKAIKRLKFTSNKNESKIHLKQTFFLIGLTIIITILIHLISLQLYPSIDFSNEFIDFLLYEEELFPFPQVYVLLPLVLLPQYQMYKLEFLQFAKYRQQRIIDIALPSTLNLVSASLLLIVIYGLTYLIQIPFDFWLISYLILEILYKYFYSINDKTHFLLRRK